MRTRLALEFSRFLPARSSRTPPKQFRRNRTVISTITPVSFRPGRVRRCNEQLAQFERETSNQVVVAVWRTMPSQSSIEDFTQRTFQAWQVGQKGRNNGAVFFVFVDDGRMRIQPGYGLEGALPDITFNTIIRDAVTPRSTREATLKAALLLESISCLKRLSWGVQGKRKNRAGEREHSE